MHWAEQHSAETSQATPFGRHAPEPPSAGLPPSTVPGPPPSAPVPVPPSTGGGFWQTYANSELGRQAVPLQQVDAAGLQGSPIPVQLPAVQREAPPSAPGRHGAPLQHWSLNWHTLPAWMQQPGVPS